jgi:hypothetical protein
VSLPVIHDVRGHCVSPRVSRVVRDPTHGGVFHQIDLFQFVFSYSLPVIDHMSFDFPGVRAVFYLPLYSPHVSGEIGLVATHPLAPKASLELAANHLVVGGPGRHPTNDFVFHYSSDPRRRRWSWWARHRTGRRFEFIIERVPTRAGGRRRRRFASELSTDNLLSTGHPRGIFGLDLKPGAFDEVPWVHINIYAEKISDCCLS